MKKINSKANKKIKYLMSLKKASKRKKEGVIIIEGQKEIKQALEAKIDIIEYYFCEECLWNKKILEDLYEYHGVALSGELFKKISYKDKPEGLLLLAKRPNLELENLKLSKNPLLLILESVEKPGNLGAILRTADAVGVEAVVLCEAKTDIYNPNSIRASLGAIFTVPVLTCSNDEALTFLKRNKINIHATGLKASVDYKSPDYKKSTAFVIGTEHEGLSDFWLSNSKENIKIPMRGKIDSLNASVSTALVLYEALRQRE